MRNVEVKWTVVAVLAGLVWLDKMHQLTRQNLPSKIGDNFAVRNAQGSSGMDGRRCSGQA